MIVLFSPDFFVLYRYFFLTAEKSSSAAAAAIADRIDRHALAAPFAEVPGASLVAVAASHVGIPLAAALELVQELLILHVLRL